MMNFPQMIVPLFINRQPRQLRYSTGALNGILFGLMLADVAWLQEYPNTPSIYELGRQGQLRYQIEPPGEEKWQALPAMIASRLADCEDLAAGRSAELRVRQGVPALARNIWRLVGNTIRAHAFVALPDGSTEDPSEVLGMRPIGFHRPGRPWPGGKIPSGMYKEARGI